MNNDYDDRSLVAQSNGDIIGRAFRVYKSHMPGFLLVLLWPSLFATIFGLGLTISWSYVIGQERGSREVSETALIVAVVCLFAGLVAKWILTLRQLALLNLTFGFAVDFKDAYSRVKSVSWDILAVFAGATALFCLFALLLAVSFLFFVTKPQIFVDVFVDWLIFAECVLFTLLTPVLLLLTLMTVCGLISQRCKIIDALKGGFRQTYHNLYRSMGFGLALSLVVTVLSYPLSLPIVIMSAFDVASHGAGQASQMPLYMMVIGQFWESFVNMFVWPVVYLAYGLFYLDLRIRKEGFDLTRRLETLELSAKEAEHGA